MIKENRFLVEIPFLNCWAHLKFKTNATKIMNSLPTPTVW